MNCIKLLLAGASMIALAACDTGQRIKAVTVDQGLESFEKSNQNRQDWRGMGFAGQTTAYMACIADFNTKTVEEGFEAAQPLFEICQTLHKDYKPDLFPVELAKDLKQAYAELSDEQIEAFGLPPRPAVR